MRHDTVPAAAPVFPALLPLYARLAPAALTLMRVMAGAALMVHGWPKLLAPMGAAGMVEGLGFHPGWLWSPALALTEFFGGLLLAIGLLARPAALAVSVVLLVTVYFHWVHLGQGYGGAELSLIWVTVTLFFAARGAGPWSADRLIGREV